MPSPEFVEEAIVLMGQLLGIVFLSGRRLGSRHSGKVFLKRFHGNLLRVN